MSILAEIIAKVQTAQVEAFEEKWQKDKKAKEQWRAENKLEKGLDTGELLAKHYGYSEEEPGILKATGKEKVSERPKSKRPTTGTIEPPPISSGD